MSANTRAGLSHLEMLDAEMWIARRLRIDLFAGMTTRESRLEHVRRHLLRYDQAASIAGDKGGQAETWADVVQRVYGEPLVAQLPTLSSLQSSTGENHP